jgi:hypothetical protein
MYQLTETRKKGFGTTPPHHPQASVPSFGSGGDGLFAGGCVSPKVYTVQCTVIHYSRRYRLLCVRYYFLVGLYNN